MANQKIYSDLLLKGDLTVGKSLTGDSIISFNNGNGKFKQDENSGRLQFTQDGTNYVDLTTNYNAGLLSKPTITDNLNGTITISAAEAMVFSLSGWTGSYKQYTIPSTTLSLINNSENYVIVSYNGGSPIYISTTTESDIDNSSKILVANVYRDGNNVIYLTIDHALAPIQKIVDRLNSTNSYQQSSGLELSEQATRTIVVGAGTVWYGANRFDEILTDSTVGAYLYYHSSGNWLKTTVTQYNNTQWDNGSNLVTLTNGRYNTNWIYRFVDNENDSIKIAIVLGDSEYTSVNSATAAPVIVPPIVLQKQAILVGRIIVLKNDSTATIASAFNNVFNGISVKNHNDTSNIQGGTLNEYYHLTQQNYSDLSGTVPISKGGTGSTSFNYPGGIVVKCLSAENLVTLPNGTSEQLLQSNGPLSAPSWISTNTLLSNNTIIKRNAYGRAEVESPQTSYQIANKNYVDIIASGLKPKLPALVASTGDNLSAVYNNALSGDYATLTSVVSARFILDSLTIPISSRVLIKDQTLKFENGVYDLTNIGSSSSKWVLTRSHDFDNDPDSPMSNGDNILITSGVVNTGRGYTVYIPTPFTIGVDNINFVQSSTTQIQHNDTLGLQGGNGSDQFYHLTNTEHVGTGTGNFVRETNPIILGTLNVSGALSATLKSIINGVEIGSSVAENCIAIGRDALAANTTTGTLNLAIGRNSMAGNGYGQQNIGIGYASISNLWTGNDNIGIGVYSLPHVDTGMNNVGIGTNSMPSNHIGNNNIAIGYSVLNSATGSNNIGIGEGADIIAGINNAMQFGSGTNSNSGTVQIWNNRVADASGLAIYSNTPSITISKYTSGLLFDLTTIPANRITTSGFTSQLVGITDALSALKKLDTDVFALNGTYGTADNVQVDYVPSGNYTAVSNTVSGHLNGINNYFNTSVVARTGSITATSGITTNVITIPNSTGAGIVFNYSAKNSTTNVRTGTLQVAYTSTNVVYNEYTTIDIGTTSAITFAPIVSGSNIQVNCSVAAGSSWTVRYSRDLL